MGHAEDPKDGGAVATAVFGAVAVYGVRSPLRYTDALSTTQHSPMHERANLQTGFPHLLRITGLAAHSRESERRDLTVISQTSHLNWNISRSLEGYLYFRGVCWTGRRYCMVLLKSRDVPGSNQERVYWQHN